MGDSLCQAWGEAKEDVLGGVLFRESVQRGGAEENTDGSAAFVCNSDSNSNRFVLLCQVRSGVGSSS